MLDRKQLFTATYLESGSKLVSCCRLLRTGITAYVISSSSLTRPNLQHQCHCTVAESACDNAIGRNRVTCTSTKCSYIHPLIRPNYPICCRLSCSASALLPFYFAIQYFYSGHINAHRKRLEKARIHRAQTPPGAGNVTVMLIDRQPVQPVAEC